MWCGASVWTRIHKTVRHTWQFDFDCSNSFSLKYVAQKESVFVCFCFCFLLSCQPAWFHTFPQPCVVAVLFFFLLLLLGVVCFISQAIWLVSESNFSLPFHRASPTLTLTHFPQLTHTAFTLQTNQFLARRTWSGTVKYASPRIPENVHSVVNVPCPLWCDEA